MLRNKVFLFCLFAMTQFALPYGDKPCKIREIYVSFSVKGHQKARFFSVADGKLFRLQLSFAHY